MSIETTARRERRRRARRRADLTAAYAILSEAAMFFDTRLGAGIAEAVEVGEQPVGWVDVGSVAEEVNGTGADRSLSSAPRPYARAV